MRSGKQSWLASLLAVTLLYSGPVSLLAGARADESGGRSGAAVDPVDVDASRSEMRPLFRSASTWKR